METVFERIIKGELPSARVYEDDLIVAFMDAGQLNPGHVLVVTRKPYETLLDADEESLVALMRAVKRIAHAIQKAYEPEGMTLLQANRPAGEQTVPHLHMHIVPRYHNDGVGLIWPRREPGLAALQEYAAKVREHLDTA